MIKQKWEIDLEYFKKKLQEIENFLNQELIPIFNLEERLPLLANKDITYKDVLFNSVRVELKLEESKWLQSESKSKIEETAKEYNENFNKLIPFIELIIFRAFNFYKTYYTLTIEPLSGKIKIQFPLIIISPLKYEESYLYNSYANAEITLFPLEKNTDILTGLTIKLFDKENGDETAPEVSKYGYRLINTMIDILNEIQQT